MEETVKDTLGTSLSWAILEGGPEGIPQASRVQLVSPIDQKIKITYYGGYEHFERTDLRDESGPFPQIVFRWTTRTKIAE
jgi:hypothetical protein